MSEPEPRLFVYGTLQAGQRNARVLHPHARGRVPARGLDLGLWTDGRLPWAWPAPGAHVEGELVTLADAAAFAALDRFEEVPTLYVRGRVQVVAGDAPLEVWTYLAPSDPAARGWARVGPRWVDPLAAG